MEYGTIFLYAAISCSVSYICLHKKSKTNSLIWQTVNVLDLLGPEQGEAIDDVEMFPPKQQQAFRRVQTLYSGTAEHVADLLTKHKQTA